jgi:hypothetical protein
LNGTHRVRPTFKHGPRTPGFLHSSLTRGFIWTTISLAALVSAHGLDAHVSSTIAVVPIFLVCVAAVVHNRQYSLVSSLTASLVLLMISRSVLAPTLLSTTAPLWVSGLVFLALAMNLRRIRLPKSTVIVTLLSLMLVLPTVIQTDLGTTAKAVGIGAMWLLVFLGAANLDWRQRPRVALAFIIAACVQAGLAVLESLVKLDVVRDLITGSAGAERYILRHNLILGDWTNRAQGTLGYPIPFAAFLTVGLFVALLSGVIRNRVVLIAILLLLMTGIVLSGTRSAAVALAVGLAAWCVSLLISARVQRKKLPGLLLAILATLVVGAAGIAFLIRSLLIGDFSLLHRSAVIDTAWGLGELPLPRLLFGSGYNSASRLFDEGILSTGGLEVIDNALISQVIASGLIGLVLLVAILVLAVRSADIATRSVLIAVVTFYFFFDVMSWHAMTGILFTAIGFAVTTRRAVSTPAAAPVAVGRRQRLGQPDRGSAVAAAE